MNRILKWLERWMTPLGTVHPALGHVTLTHDHCPHCEERTLCEVNVLRRHQRCVQCGHRPHGRTKHEAERDPAEAVAV